MHRVRSVRLLTSWVFVAALLVKGAVPMLASAAAALQGKPLAEICAVYGVDTSMLRAPAGLAKAAAVAAPAVHEDPHPGSHHRAHRDAHDDRNAHDAHDVHAGHDAHAGHDVPTGHDAGSGHDAAAGDPAHDAPTRVAHGGDHCALTALAFALGADLVAVAPAPPAVAPALCARTGDPVAVDPAARWAAQLQHGPPAFS